MTVESSLYRFKGINVITLIFRRKYLQSQIYNGMAFMDQRVQGPFLLVIRYFRHIKVTPFLPINVSQGYDPQSEVRR